MELNLTFLLACCLILACSADEATVDYYVNLINEEVARAHSYPLPNDSSVFIPSNSNSLDYGTFDYIIVGGGSAGTVLANRLSEIPENKILLLEVGGRESNFSDIPAMMIYLQGLEYNWNYHVVPQTTVCQGMINKQCSYPRGKALGGSSVINALMYVRGNKWDFDNWGRQGNIGWSYRDLLPYFKKSEDSRIDGDAGYHGTGGNIHVEYHTPNNRQFDAFVEANLERGRKLVDFNGREQLGVGRTQMNTVDGRRDSTGKAYLRPVEGRPNLTILPNTLVTKILTRRVGTIILKNEAYGVLFSHDGKLYTANSRKEVLVSGGVIGSPQLLMLSGIGPLDQLLRFQIPVVQPLPVGDNFQDHPAFFGLFFESNYTEPAKTLEQNVEEFLSGYGPLTFTGNPQGVGFLQTKFANIPGVPDIEIIMISSKSGNDYIRNAFRYTNTTYNSVWGKVDYSNYFAIYVILLHPKSRGTVKLRSSDPYDYPDINPRALSDPLGQDIEAMYQGIQLVLDIVNTNAFKKLNAKLAYTPVPACQHHEYLSRSYWYCQLRQLTAHIFHPVGTCKMGPTSLTGAVVNHKLQVHGVEKLRVIDASVMPETISGHTNAATVAIAEKMSDMLKNGE